MIRTSNHWGEMNTTTWNRGSPDYMQSIGGARVEGGRFFYFKEPVTGFVLYKNMFWVS